MTEEELSQKKCIACEGGTSPLTKEEAGAYLKDFPGWSLLENSIEREYEFKDFSTALSFVNKVGTIAEEENHHPDIFLHNWNKVKITLSTHAIEGLSENDFILASKIEKLIPF